MNFTCEEISTSRAKLQISFQPTANGLDEESQQQSGRMLHYNLLPTDENGGWMRGWKGLAVVEVGEVQNAKNASVESGVLVEQNNNAEVLAA